MVESLSKDSFLSWWSPFLWAVQFMLLQQLRDEAGGVLVHLQMPRLSPWVAASGQCDLKTPHHWHMAHSSEDWTVLPSIIAVTGMLQGIWLAFKGWVFKELRAQHLPFSLGGMFVSISCAWEIQIQGTASHFQLFKCDVLTLWHLYLTNKWGLRCFWL